MKQLYIRKAQKQGERVYHDENCSMVRYHREDYRVATSKQLVGRRACTRSGPCRQGLL